MHRSATAKVPTRPMAKLTPIVVAIGFALYQSSPALGEAPDKKTEAYQNLPSMSWPVLPGENLNQLAKLFYPKNKAMQKRFIEASIVLSKEINPNLKPQTAYRQPSSIMIPELEALSAMAKKSDGKQKRLRMSYRIASVPLEEVTPEMEKEYEDLAARNEKAKVELEQLNRRLAELQIRLEKLKEAAQKWLEQQAKLEAQKNEAALNSANTVTQNPAEPEPALQVPQQPDAKPAPATPARVKKAAKPTEPVEVEDSLSNKLEQLWVPSLMFLLAALVALLYVFRKRLPFKNVFSESKPINLDTDQPRVTSNDSVLEIVKGNNTLNEERISSVTEDARRLFNKGKTDEALELLNDAINFSAKRSITTWLYLLDLYRTLDKRIEFERLADRFHKNFNVMAPLWNPVEVNVVVANSLEDFPHVLEELQLHWQKGDADIFLDTLISDNRDGERTGFSLAVLEEIMLLKNIWQNKDYLFDQDSFDKEVFDNDGFDEDGLPILKK
jgi:hypothetical protein